MVEENRAFVAGEMIRATSYALYALLYQLGCDWVMPSPMGVIVPQRSTVTLSSRTEESAPSFGYRHVWCGGSGEAITGKEELAEWNQWMRRLRMGKAEVLADDGQGHIWDQLIAKYKDEFKKDPTMLALVQRPNGKRVRSTPQVETTHPKVLEVAIRYIRETFEKRKWPKDKRVVVPIGPADGEGYSVSPESVAVSSNRPDPLLGGPDATDQVMEFANRILNAIGDEYPNLMLGYYVYSQHADYR